MFELKEVFEFRTFFGRELGLFFALHKFGNPSQCLGRGMEVGDFLGRRPGGYKLKKLQVDRKSYSIPYRHPPW